MAAGDVEWVACGHDCVAGSGAPYSYEISGGAYLPGGHETINGSGWGELSADGGAEYVAAGGAWDGRCAGGAWVCGEERMEGSGFAEGFNLLNERSLTRVETRGVSAGDRDQCGCADAACVSRCGDDCE